MKRLTIALGLLLALTIGGSFATPAAAAPAAPAPATTVRAYPPSCSNRSGVWWWINNPYTSVGGGHYAEGGVCHENPNYLWETSIDIFYYSRYYGSWQFATGYTWNDQGSSSSDHYASFSVGYCTNFQAASTDDNYSSGWSYSAVVYLCP